MWFEFLLIVHSLTRWLVCLSLLSSCGFACYSLVATGRFTNAHKGLQDYTHFVLVFATLIGAIVYVFSPLVRYFFRHIGEPIESHEIRYFALIHVIAMLSLPLISYAGRYYTNKAVQASAKLRSLAIWSMLPLLTAVIFSPWPIVTEAYRPLIR